mmetsp:Transcript_7885/g.22514  ORF Transcript_7885/g.22514 Transcript_7885/m.22514 type:complete len:335 (-) Transcript_7885:213-1217(-)|eukprot:CAMPEP_0117653154 /NCGR_PEP_ID=MMETSP0804-20121206/3034_1 /TAXON_ID=1074897 /ORGANISM="Tetraselmis astigmatica, Strain CCMP880" /LENGTH=334 /DNA_ID=CAMNT_0005459299 /DNA_START=307 /DNA_END=1311 /DNA_ORIENTATION=+
MPSGEDERVAGQAEPSDAGPQFMPPFVNLPCVRGSEASTALSHEEYLKQHHIGVYLKDVVNVIIQRGDQNAPAADLLAAYFTTVCTGRHLKGQPYSFLSGTPFNRCHFLRDVQHSFEAMHNDTASKEVKLMDCLSMLMLLCADFPLNVVRSAFKPAAFISKGVSQLDNSGIKVPLRIFLDCLAVTFMYERFLVEMRHEAFESKSKQFVSLPRVKESMAVVSELVAAAGWPAPPPDIILVIVDLAADAKKCISFDILVRSMCDNPALRNSIWAQTKALGGQAADALKIAEAAQRFRSQVDAEVASGMDHAAAWPVGSTPQQGKLGARKGSGPGRP